MATRKVGEVEFFSVLVRRYQWEEVHGWAMLTLKTVWDPDDLSPYSYSATPSSLRLSLQELVHLRNPVRRRYQCCISGMVASRLHSTPG